MSRSDITREELFSHNKPDDCWVSMDDKYVYDLTSFIGNHPGGRDTILALAGRDITEAMKIPYEHSQSAYSIMKQYLIGELIPREKDNFVVPEKETPNVDLSTYDSTIFSSIIPTQEMMTKTTDAKKDYEKHHFLDLDKPMVWQLLRSNFSRDFYVDQVHRPRHYGKGAAPIFGGFLEVFTKTPWYVIPILWGSVFLWLFTSAMKEIHLFSLISLFLIGLSIWPFIEYFVHRCVFHIDDKLPSNRFFYVLHFLAHGVHHTLPMDRYRLVMPPALFCCLSSPFVKLYFTILPHYHARACFSGTLLGYILYDLTHYALHHAPLPKVFQPLKRHHLAHHYQNFSLGFGITNRVLDGVFGTSLDENSPLSGKNIKNE